MRVCKYHGPQAEPRWPDVYDDESPVAALQDGYEPEPDRDYRHEPPAVALARLSLDRRGWAWGGHRDGGEVDGE